MIAKPPKRGKGSVPKKTVAQVLERDNWACARCGGLGGEIHHRLPKSRGGTHDLRNLVLICGRCHRWVHNNPAKAKEEGWTL